MAMQRVDDETNAVLSDDAGIQVIVTYADQTSRQFDFADWKGFKKNVAAITDEKPVAALFARDLSVPLPRGAAQRKERLLIEGGANG